MQTDGQLRTGRDVIIATMKVPKNTLATVALVTMGCIMMRASPEHRPVGIATQDDELRGKFNGSADHVVNYFTMMAQEIREYMAEIGSAACTSWSAVLTFLQSTMPSHWKSQGLDLAPLLHRPDVGPT